MIYDTGAVVSLLPAMFYSLLEMEESAPIKLSGISPEVEVDARLTRTSLRLQDGQGKTSPRIEAWTATAEKDNVPLILGLKDVSDTHNFRVDAKKKMFYLDFERNILHTHLRPENMDRPSTVQAHSLRCRRGSSGSRGRACGRV